jgi:predicted MPP superfamily phosphohydrolase
MVQFPASPSRLVAPAPRNGNMAQDPDSVPDIADDALAVLERRIGRRHALQRLGTEREHESQVLGQGLNFFHIENSALSARAIEYALKMTGLFWRGRRNADRVTVRLNTIGSRELPAPFDGFTVLHLSDLHCDRSKGAMLHLARLLPSLTYDICVLTGDFRGGTRGPFAPALAVMSELLASMRGPMYGVLGNHDSMRMVPSLEKMGVRVLMNEADVIARGGQRLHIAGIDDAHFYRADDIGKAAASIPHDEFSILLSHTAEIYREAGHAGFNLLLSGHTHGGQICLPGGIPITLDSALPRRLGAGPWQHRHMHGYTSVGAGSSVVPVRFNCPPEVTLHTLKRTG